MSDSLKPEAADLVPVAATSQAIAPISMGMLQASNPVELMTAAAAIATPLRRFIEERGLMKFLGGDTPFVYVEGWTTMLAMLGVMPQEISVQELPLNIQGWGSKYVAKMALVRISDQTVVCSASAECGGEDERDWHFRPKYRWEEQENGKKVKIPDGETPVSGSQRRSMALTRATGKAARIGFSWIMTMAGYSPTPYEELDQADIDAHQDPAATGPKASGMDQGRNPRDMMGKRGAYEPGGQNPPPQATRVAPGTAPQAAKAPEPAAGGAVPADGQRPKSAVRKIVSKYRFDCMVCADTGSAGESMAYCRDADGTFVAHWACYEGRLATGQ